MNFKLIDNATSSEVDVLIIPFFKGSIEFDRIKSLTDIDITDEFSGELKEYSLLYSNKSKTKIYILGLGKADEPTKSNIAFRNLFFKHKAKWGSRITIDLSHMPASIVFQSVLGIKMSTYNIGFLKTQNSKVKKSEKSTISIVTNLENNEMIFEAETTADSICRAMKLVDEPSNIKTPQYLASWAKESAKEFKYSCKILSKSELEKKGLHALLAVGQGSIHHPVMITTEYKNKNFKGNKPKIVLVGKGITFDTGGISIKHSQNMHYMKSDMGGAAAVLGAVELAARLQLKTHIIGLIPSAENAVDANSIKPGDVINSYSGKTIEVIDTDAEGRLVLADGLAYAIKNFKPEYLVDLATLTGNSVMALGYAAGALFSNDKEFAYKILECGQSTNERVWQLPLWDDYIDDIRSDIADVRNFSGKPVAGAISAAKFLEFFVNDHPKWAHLDIAGVAFGSSEFSKMKSAKGFGVRLLIDLIKKL